MLTNNEILILNVVCTKLVDVLALVNYSLIVCSINSITCLVLCNYSVALCTVINGRKITV